MTKSDVLTSLHHAIESRLKTLQSEMDELLKSMANDTKSTAGDKHETSRAMAQLEQEKIGNQIAETSKFLQSFNALANSKPSPEVQIGSFIQTNTGFFMLGIAFGQLTVENESVFCLSTVSPMGQLLLNKKVGDKFELNGRALEVLMVE